MNRVWYNHTMNKSLTNILEIRVRYSETDAMGFLHHANYFNYFEMGRTELLRQSGGSYRQMEEAGYHLVVVSIDCKYRKPARYDDLLSLKTELVSESPVKLQHTYSLMRGEEILATASSTLACIGRDGRVARIPKELTA